MLISDLGKTIFQGRYPPLENAAYDVYQLFDIMSPLQRVPTPLERVRFASNCLFQKVTCAHGAVMVVGGLTSQ